MHTPPLAARRRQLSRPLRHAPQTTLLPCRCARASSFFRAWLPACSCAPRRALLLRGHEGRLPAAAGGRTAWHQPPLSLCLRPTAPQGIADGSLTVGDAVLFVTLMQQLYGALSSLGWLDVLADA